VKVHQAAWKARSPRDLGAGWDFDDVRDHYMALLFGVDPVDLRYSDHDRYLDLGRVATGEVMAQTFGEWRRKRSLTRGGLVWFLRDLWPGAGWGVVDASGAPKAAWHYLRRALAPVALHLSDEGGNGLVVHAVNDGANPIDGELILTLWRGGEIRVGSGTKRLTVPACRAIEFNATEWFDGFHDLSYAYRFGPPSHEVAAATLLGADGRELARAFHFVNGWPSARELDIGLSASIAMAADGKRALAVRTRRFAQSVQVDIEGFACSDNYFHLAPGESRTLTLLPLNPPGQSAASPRGVIRALNSEAAAKVAPA
jgi:beta-mannosidase